MLCTPPPRVNVHIEEAQIDIIGICHINGASLLMIAPQYRLEGEFRLRVPSVNYNLGKCLDFKSGGKNYGKTSIESFPNSMPRSYSSKMDDSTKDGGA